MVKIKLNKKEFTYLSQLSFFPKNISTPIRSREHKEDAFILEVSEEQTDKIRDLCGERLQIVGFDEKYELTQEGKFLESLIDKFFIG